MNLTYQYCMLNKMNSKDLANFYEIENISQYMCCAHQNKSISKKDMVHNDKKFQKSLKRCCRNEGLIE